MAGFHIGQHLTPKRIWIGILVLFVILVIYQLQSLRQTTNSKAFKNNPDGEIAIPTAPCPKCKLTNQAPQYLIVSTLKKFVPIQMDIALVSVQESTANLNAVTSASKFIFSHLNDHVFYDFPHDFFGSDKSPHEVKYLAIQKVLERHQWAFWTDSNSLVSNFELRLASAVMECSRNNEVCDVVVPMNQEESKYILIRRTHFTSHALQSMLKTSNDNEWEAFNRTLNEMPGSTLYLDMDDFIDADSPQVSLLIDYADNDAEKASESLQGALQTSKISIANFISKPDNELYDHLVTLKAKMWNHSFSKYKELSPRNVLKRYV